MNEMPFYFRQHGQKALFGVLHRPSDPDPQRTPFVFCHPLGEEKLWSHRVFVSYARELVAAGHTVLRFDLLGNGDSEGEFSDLSLEQACRDVADAVAEVRRQTGLQEVSLLGLRFGATLAAIVAARTEHLRHLILWAPVTNGERYMQELLRLNVMTQMAVHREVRLERPALVKEMEQGRTVNVDGYELGWPLYSSVSAIQLPEPSGSFAGECLIVQIEKQPRPAADLQQLATSYPRAAVEFAEEEPFWKEIARFYQQAPNLFQVTTDWIRAR